MQIIEMSWWLGLLGTVKIASAPTAVPKWFLTTCPVA